MIETKRDLARRFDFEKAGIDAKKNGVYIPSSSLNEQLDKMHAKAGKPKKKIPWFTIITVATTLPMFFGGGGGMTSGAMSMLSSAPRPSVTSSTKSSGQMKEMASQAKQMLGNESAKVSVSFGGQTFEKEISASDLDSISY